MQNDAPTISNKNRVNWDWFCRFDGIGIRIGFGLDGIKKVSAKTKNNLFWATRLTSMEMVLVIELSRMLATNETMIDSFMFVLMILTMNERKTVIERHEPRFLHWDLS